jgi:sulfoxide reductase catalytic subunit YedY
MKTRRAFIKSVIGILTGATFSLAPFSVVVKNLYAKIKKIVLPKGTKRESLVDKNPAELDPRNLPITPLEEFGKMGLSEHVVDLREWRLEIEGHLKNPLKMTYEKIKALPSIKRKVLLICPGYFANYGEWEGISFKEIFKICKAKSGITHVTVRGPSGPYGKTERFPMEDIVADKVFLAYNVNGKPLPEKHGFPLRIVAEDRYGFEWVKFVYSVTVDKIEG